MKLQFTNRTYDALRWIAQTLLPAIATLYVALSTVWNLPYSTQVSETILAIVLFMSVLLNLSTNLYLKAASNQQLLDRYSPTLQELEVAMEIVRQRQGNVAKQIDPSTNV